MRTFGILAAAVVGFGVGTLLGGSMDVVFATASDAQVVPVVAIAFGLIGAICLAWLVARLLPRGPRSLNRKRRGEELMHRFSRRK